MASVGPNSDDSTVPRSGETNALPYESAQLPADFLRLATPSEVRASGETANHAGVQVSGGAVHGSTPLTAQIAADEQLARALQAAEGGAQTQPQPVSGPAYVFPQGAAPAGYIRRLRVTFFQAKLQKNYGLMRMDPYCRVRVGRNNLATPTAESGGKNPAWNRTVHCPLDPGVDSIYVELFDEGTFSEDELIAWAHIPIPQQALSGNRVIDWYPLSGKLGEGKEGVVQIATQVEYVPAAMPMYYAAAPMPGMYMQPGVAPQPYVMAPQSPSSHSSSDTSAQSQSPAAPISEDDVAQLREMFSSFDIAVIRSVLETSRGNKEEAINSLLQLATDSPPTQSAE